MTFAEQLAARVAKSKRVGGGSAFVVNGADRTPDGGAKKRCPVSCGVGGDAGGVAGHRRKWHATSLVAAESVTKDDIAVGDVPRMYSLSLTPSIDLEDDDGDGQPFSPGFASPSPLSPPQSSLARMVTRGDNGGGGRSSTKKKQRKRSSLAERREALQNRLRWEEEGAEKREWERRRAVVEDASGASKGDRELEAEDCVLRYAQDGGGPVIASESVTVASPHTALFEHGKSLGHGNEIDGCDDNDFGEGGRVETEEKAEIRSLSPRRNDDGSGGDRHNGRPIDVQCRISPWRSSPTATRRNRTTAVVAAASSLISTETPSRMAAPAISGWGDGEGIHRSAEVAAESETKIASHEPAAIFGAWAQIESLQRQLREAEKRAEREFRRANDLTRFGTSPGDQGSQNRRQLFGDAEDPGRTGGRVEDDRVEDDRAAPVVVVAEVRGGGGGDGEKEEERGTVVAVDRDDKEDEEGEEISTGLRWEAELRRKRTEVFVRRVARGHRDAHAVEAEERDVDATDEECTAVDGSLLEVASTNKYSEPKMTASALDHPLDGERQETEKHEVTGEPARSSTIASDNNPGPIVIETTPDRVTQTVLQPPMLSRSDLNETQQWRRRALSVEDLLAKERERAEVASVLGYALPSAAATTAATDLVRLKNAEIDVLRSQIDRLERQVREECARADVMMMRSSIHRHCHGNDGDRPPPVVVASECRATAAAAMAAEADATDPESIQSNHRRHRDASVVGEIRSLHEEIRNLQYELSLTKRSRGISNGRQKVVGRKRHGRRSKSKIDATQSSDAESSDVVGLDDEDIDDEPTLSSSLDDTHDEDGTYDDDEEGGSKYSWGHVCCNLWRSKNTKRGYGQIHGSRNEFS